MDIGGTKKKIQRLSKVAEQSYKKMNEMLERIQKLQTDMETTSSQVDHIEDELAEQRALLESLAEQQGLDVDQVLADADFSDSPDQAEEEQTESEGTQQATTSPSTTEQSE